ncbi:MAG: polymer-forming cytoskeletal protein [Acidobacteria bacterium]|nr:polymer-forming cytoskeletal protein [Acidobacteriota bacterium]
MWKREEAAKPVAPPPTATSPAPASGVARPSVREIHIGKSVVIKGELNGSEDLTIEGQVEGKIELRDHMLTIGPHGRIRAEVFAKTVIILGEVIGNIRATERVSIQDAGRVEGDISAPKVAISEGSRFRGSVDMSPAKQPEAPRTGQAPRIEAAQAQPTKKDSMPAEQTKEAPPSKPAGGS